MLPKEQLFIAINELIARFNRTNFKADLLFKQQIGRYGFSKSERFFVMDAFYYYLRHRYLVEFFQQFAHRDFAWVIMQLMTQEDYPSDWQVAWDALDSEVKLQYQYSLSSYWYHEASKVFDLVEQQLFFRYLQERAPTTLLILLKRNSRESIIHYLQEAEVATQIGPLPMMLYAEGQIRAKGNIFFDIQDSSSQLIALLFKQEAVTLLDYCSGYGGKSIAFGSLWPTLQIIASDIRNEVKQPLLERAKRAGIKLRWRLQKELERNHYPFVLVDAPCSGSGVWRRNPEDRYRISEAELLKLADQQLAILLQAGQLVAKGGDLLYVTCSFTRVENESVIEKFLASTRQYQVVSILDRLKENSTYLGIEQEEILPLLHEESLPYLRIKPKSGGGDIFFAALLQRVGS